jgi:hypothetical protein
MVVGSETRRARLLNASARSESAADGVTRLGLTPTTSLISKRPHPNHSRTIEPSHLRSNVRSCPLIALVSKKPSSLVPIQTDPPRLSRAMDALSPASSGPAILAPKQTRPPSPSSLASVRDTLSSSDFSSSPSLNPTLSPLTCKGARHAFQPTLLR